MESQPYEPALQPPARTSGMAITSLVLGLFSFILSIITGLPAILLGVIALVRISNSRGALTGTGMAIAGIITGGMTSLMVPILIALLLPAVQAAREAARVNMSMNNVKQLQLAMLNYESVNQHLPAAGGGDAANGGTQLSWRVHMLPYLEEPALYEQFHLDEPWDSEHNRTLIPMMPAYFQNPNQPTGPESGMTNYLAVTGPGAFFQGEQPGPRIQDIRDGMSQTVMIVEADPDQAVVWTKPDDWQFDPQNPTQGLGNLRSGAFVVGMGDGSVQRVSNAINPQEFADMVLRDNGASNNGGFGGGGFGGDNLFGGGLIEDETSEPESFGGDADGGDLFGEPNE